MIISLFLLIRHSSKTIYGIKFNPKISFELWLKILLLLLMCITFFIPPITFSSMIIDWNQIGALNYIRAFIFLIGCSFLPGSSIFNILFSNSKLHQRFKIESFILKLTLYPILSFILLGTVVMVLDQIGFNDRIIFTNILYSLILFLFFIEILLYKRRNSTFEMKEKKKLI